MILQQLEISLESGLGGLLVGSWLLVVGRGKLVISKHNDPPRPRSSVLRLRSSVLDLTPSTYRVVFLKKGRFRGELATVTNNSAKSP